MDARASIREGPEEGSEAGAERADGLLVDLNEPQRRAVTRGEGPVLILAGAGSGKTRVITRRIGWLIATGRARPGEVLAITFTNKAAKEMRTRVEALLEARGLWIATFHATCARILRRDIETLGGWTRDFTIYDTHDRNQLLKALTKEAGYDVQRFRPAMLGGWISEWKAERWADWRSGEEGPREEAPDGPVGVDEEVFAIVRERYERAMREHNALDFDDLLVKVLELFEEHPGVRDAYANRFRHVLVDEYQDTNRVQYLLTRHLARWHGNLTVCGDPDQSIYAWRGADIQNILGFEKDFGAGGQVEVVKLEQNYRSTRCILSAAQGLIRHNLSRKEKDLWTERASDHKVVAIECGDEEDEANEIAAQIHTLREEGVRPDQIAVFYRVNFMQRALERGLRLAGVPYQIVGGVEFYQRKEIRDLLSYLHLLVNPRDDVACRRALNVPARGIGEKSLAVLQDQATARGLSLSAAACSEEARAAVRGRARAGLAAFAGLLEILEGAAERPAGDALESVLDETEYLDWLAKSPDADAVNREENVEELLSHARTYDGENPEGGLRGFLQEVALVSDVDGYDEAGPKVALMTLHASKGLEFPAVFIAGLEEELLPHALALADAADGAGEEEERRLLYVGMTRAEDRLFLMHARVRRHFGEASHRLPSRFLSEVPPEFLEASAEEDEDEFLGDYEAPEEVDDLCVGDAVAHDHFGRGRVVRLQGAGVNARVTIEFPGVGSKILLVQYAKLKVLDR